MDDFRCVELEENDLKKSNLFYGLEFIVLPLLSDSKVSKHDVER